MTAALDRARQLLDQPPTAVLPGQLAAPHDGLRIGSVCSGYRGLDMAVEAVFGGTTAWVSDIDPGANRILAHHWPDTPNLGDLTTTRWEDVEPVDIFCGGYPCQPFSLAGKQRGTADERHIWPSIARALGVLRPRLAIFENVGGHLRLGFDAVLADLARLGFDAEWICVRASDSVLAPHPRRRLILLATAAHTDGDTLWEQPVAKPGGNCSTITELVGADAASHSASLGWGEGWPESAGQQGGPGAPGGGVSAWGQYEPAIRRWEAVLGRRAPGATDARHRLNPAFVEWLMGLPAGHVTAVPGLTRNQQLHALGNGVVPQQAEAALRLLHARAADLEAMAA